MEITYPSYTHLRFLTEPIPADRLRLILQESTSWDDCFDRLSGLFGCGAHDSSATRRALAKLLDQLYLQGRQAAFAILDISPKLPAKRRGSLAMAFSLWVILALNQANDLAQRYYDRLPDDEDEPSAEKLAEIFQRWKNDQLDPTGEFGLARESIALFLEPTLRFAWAEGYFSVLNDTRWGKRKPFWRYRLGHACTLHRPLDGLTRHRDDAVWASCLPPLSPYCDCWIEPTVEGESGETPRLPPFPDMYRYDKRGGPWEFFRYYIRAMREECHDDKESA